MKYSFTLAALLLMAPNVGAQLVPSHVPSTPSAQGTQASSATTSLQVTGKPVVRINGAVLTDRDLVREMLALFPYARLHNGFPKKQEAEIRRGAMQMMIFEELVYQEATRRKMTIAPQRILQDEKKFEQQFRSQAEFRQYVKTEMGGSEAKLRQQIKRSLLIEALLKSEVDTKAAVSAQEARAFYDKNPKVFEHGETFTIQTISIIPPANANPETLKETAKHAQSVLEQAKATKTYEQFGLLAEKVSEDDYRVNMGDRKSVPSANLPVEVVKVAQAMKVGDVSGLIQLGTAYTIVRLNAHGLPGKANFADVKSKLISSMQKEKYEHLRVELDKRLHQNATIQEL